MADQPRRQVRTTATPEERDALARGIAAARRRRRDADTRTPDPVANPAKCPCRDYSGATNLEDR